MDATVGRWDFDRWGPPSVEAIRALHQPASRYRISPASYLAGTAFGGTARAGRKYVLAGACAFIVGPSTWELQAGDFADIPEGEYLLRVLGSEPVELVSVWELPPAFWGRGVA
jgi:hypothetical protein